MSWDFDFVPRGFKSYRPKRFKLMLHEKILLGLIALFLLAFAVDVFAATPMVQAIEAEEETCMTNAECCEMWRERAFINSDDGEIAALCAEYL